MKKLSAVLFVVFSTACTDKYTAESNVAVTTDANVEIGNDHGTPEQPLEPGRQCSCEKVPEMNDATVECGTTILSNESKLYWQFNCKKIWLTLENKAAKRRVISEVPVELFPYTYRLGFHFIKEFEKGVLFRSGCSASGPCAAYYLVDKTNGKIIKEFPQLIDIDTDILNENPHPYPFDFVVYLSEKKRDLVVYFVESGRMIKVQLEEDPTDVIPERQFRQMSVDNDILNLQYADQNGTTNPIRIDMSEAR